MNSIEERRPETMGDRYGDGTDCKICRNCGLCIDHNDCKNDGCGKEKINLIPKK